MPLYIYSKSDGLLHWNTELTDPLDAWRELRSVVGHDRDQPGTCSRDMFVWSDSLGYDKPEDGNEFPADPDPEGATS